MREGSESPIYQVAGVPEMDKVCPEHTAKKTAILPLSNALANLKQCGPGRFTYCLCKSVR